jgi:hypothetical protein
MRSRRGRGVHVGAALLALVSSCCTAKRVAVCLVGQARSFVNPDLRANFNDTILAPLGANVDVFVHVDTGDVPVQQVLDLFSADARFVSVVVEQSVQRSRANCQTRGWPQFDKWKSCYADVLRYEEEHAVQHTWFLRVRLDLYSAVTLPPFECWKGLRKDVLWDHHTQFRTSVNQTVDAVNNTFFISDWIALTSWKLAQVTYSVADDLDACVPVSPPTPDPCSGRWDWPECRLLARLNARAPEASVGILLKARAPHWGIGNKPDGVVDLARCQDGWQCTRMKLGFCNQEVPHSVALGPSVFFESDYEKPPPAGCL